MKKVQRKLQLRLETLHHLESAHVIGGSLVLCGPPVFTGPGLNTFAPGQLTYYCTTDQAIEN